MSRAARVRVVLLLLYAAVQLTWILTGANGPVEDESLYALVGLRILNGPADVARAYTPSFNGSPWAWPLLAGPAHALGGLVAQRGVAVLLTLAALAWAAGAVRRIFGDAEATWFLGAFLLSGPLFSLAHLAVYDVLALFLLAGAFRLLASRADGGDGAPDRAAGTTDLGAVAAGFLLGLAFVAKYGYALMAPPLVILAMALAPRGRRVRVGARVALPTLAVMMAYLWRVYGGLRLPSAASYATATGPRRLTDLLPLLQAGYVAVPLVLAVLGWRRLSSRREKMVGAVMVASLLVWPLFHLAAHSTVSGRKHVVAGFLLGYPLVGVFLATLWRRGARARVVALLAGLGVWGAFQARAGERFWPDYGAAAAELARRAAPGDGVLVSRWPSVFALALRDAGKLDGPGQVVSLETPAVPAGDPCAFRWMVRTAGRSSPPPPSCLSRRAFSERGRVLAPDGLTWLEVEVQVLTSGRSPPATPPGPLPGRSTRTPRGARAGTGT